MEKPFESPPPPSRTLAAAGQQLEGRGRARLILNLRPAPVCLRPGTDSCTVPGKAPFQMAGPTSPPARGAQPPAGSPFRRAGFPGQDSGRCPSSPPPRASLPASPHRVMRKRRESWRGCPPLLPDLAGSRSCANLPSGPGSPLECAPGAGPPACIPRAAGPAPPPRSGGRGGETVGLGNGACP